MPLIEKLILGTVQFGLDYGINNPTGKPSTDAVLDILSYALEKGVTTLDTADAYGRADELIGFFHQHSERKFKVNTKFICHESKTVIEQLEFSLDKLHIDCINVFFYHRFSDLKNHKSVANDLQKLKTNSRIRKVGVSVYTNDELKQAINADEVDCIQLPFNLLDNTYQRGALLKEAKRRGKEIQVRSVFLQGLFFKDMSTYAPYLQPLKKYIAQIKEIADEANISMAELALGYALAEPSIDSVIIGVDTKAQLEKNLSHASQLPAEAIIKKIDSIAVQETELLYPYNWK